MKKTLAALTALILLFGLSACGGTANAGGKPDGTYTAQGDDASTEAAYGWRDTLVVTYKNGAITEAVFESYNADGVKKSEDPTYEMPVPPSEWIPQLSENVKAAGKSDEVAAVAGATNSSNNAKALLAAIEKSGTAGETITVALG